MDRAAPQRTVRCGDRVEVKTRYCGGWASGFEVADTSDGGCRVRRVSDGVVLPAVFGYDDLRAVSDPELDTPIEYEPRFTAPTGAEQVALRPGQWEQLPRLSKRPSSEMPARGSMR